MARRSRGPVALKRFFLIRSFRCEFNDIKPKKSAGKVSHCIRKIRKRIIKRTSVILAAAGRFEKLETPYVLLVLLKYYHIFIGIKLIILSVCRTGRNIDAVLRRIYRGLQQRQNIVMI